MFTLNKIKEIRNKKLAVFSGAGVFLCLLFFIFFFNAPSAQALTIGKPANFLAMNSGLVGHWTFDGKDTVWTSATEATALDKSGNGNTGTLTNMSIETGPASGKIGQGLRFDGVNDRISVPAADSLTLANKSVSFWVKANSLKDYNGIANFGGCPASTGYLFFTSIGALVISYVDGLGNANYYEPIGARDALIPGRWQHFVVTYYTDGVNNTFTGYRDGVYYGVNISNTNGMTARCLNSLGGVGSSYSLDGTLDDVRIYNRVLSEAEVKQLYNQGEAKLNVVKSSSSGTGLDSGLVGHWTFDGKDTVWTSATEATALDKSGNGNTGTLTNMSIETGPAAGKIGQGLRFDGVDDYINISSNASLDITGDITVSVWVKPNYYGSLSSYGIICDSVHVGNNFCLRLRNSAGGDVSFYINPGDGYYYYMNKGTLNYGLWNHIVSSWDGTRIYAYINGINVSAGDTKTSTSKVHSFNTMWIGRNSSFTSYYMDGMIDDLRVYNRTLSTNEIEQLYNQGEAKLNATKSSSSGTGLDSGLVGHWTFDGKDTVWTSATEATALDKSGNGNTGTLTNMSIETGPASGKIGQGLKFDGSNDCVNISTSSSLTNYSQKSVFMWVFPQSSDGGDVFSNGYWASPYGDLFQYNNNATTAHIKNIDGTKVSGSFVTTIGFWTYMGYTYDGSVVRYYTNGIESGSSDPLSGTLSGTGMTIYLGSRNGFVAYGGTLDDVRVYNRALSADEVKQLYNSGR